MVSSEGIFLPGFQDAEFELRLNTRLQVYFIVAFLSIKLL